MEARDGPTMAMKEGWPAQSNIGSLRVIYIHTISKSYLNLTIADIYFMSIIIIASGAGFLRTVTLRSLDGISLQKTKQTEFK